MSTKHLLLIIATFATALLDVPGEYLLRLSANDGSASAFDTASVRVTERNPTSYLTLDEVDAAICGGSFNRRIRIRNSHACAALSYRVGVTRQCRDGSRGEPLPVQSPAGFDRRVVGRAGQDLAERDFLAVLRRDGSFQ